MSAPAPAAPATTRRSGWDGLRLLLVLVWLVLGLSALVLHESASSLEQLYSDARGGAVERVQLVGGLSAYGDGRGSGSARLDVHWSAGHRRHVVELVEDAGEPSDAVQGGTRTTDDVAAVLRGLDPGLQVRQQPFQGGWSTTVLGTRLPGAVVPVVLGAALLTLLLLVNGPVPWRATRWAWFWLLPLPGGVIAFLVLSGWTPGVPAPSYPYRRLTGGWAFLLGVVLTPTWAGIP